jgi:alpha-D-ribose 1-methylphosphonate 5-triphosphate synthase subunit PhnH
MNLHGTCPPTQAVFRALVDAMSHPGRTRQLPGSAGDSDATDSLYRVVEVLLDHEVSYCVLGPRREAIDARIFAQTKARRAPLARADYLVIEPCDSRGKISEAKRGTLRYPDTGATAIYLVPNAESDSDAHPRITIEGPGIQGRNRPQMPALNRRELLAIRRCNLDYPLGVDCIFLDAHRQVMCLPRTTQIEVN